MTTDKPSQKEDVDEATVYTFALAWVKIDEQGKELAGPFHFFKKKGEKKKPCDKKEGKKQRSLGDSS